MYVRSITYHVKPWVTQGQASSIYDELLNVMQPLPGFQGMSLLLNENTRRAMSLSYWENQTCAADAGPKILPILLGRAEEFVDHPPEISGFDLIRHDAALSEVMLS